MIDEIYKAGLLERLENRISRNFLVFPIKKRGEVDDLNRVFRHVTEDAQDPSSSKTLGFLWKVNFVLKFMALEHMVYACWSDVERSKLQRSQNL